MASGWQAPPQFQDAEPLAKALFVLLPLYFAAGVAGQAFNVVQYSSGDGFASARFSVYGGTGVGGLLLGLASFGLSIALAIVFGFWMARAHHNAAVVSGAPLPDSTGWAVGSWYIPIVGGFLAAGPLVRMWQRGPGGPKTIPATWAILFSVYQIFAVVGTVIIFSTAFSQAFAAASSHPSSPPAFMFSPQFIDQLTIYGVVSLVLYGTVGVFMFLTIRDVQRAHRLAAGSRGMLAPSWSGPAGP